MARITQTRVAGPAPQDPAGAVGLEFAAPQCSTKRPGFQASLAQRRLRLGRTERTGG